MGRTRSVLLILMLLAGSRSQLNDYDELFCIYKPALGHVVIIGGGPGGYESALVAAQLGAEVTVVDSDGLGGSAVLTDCVPSKTLIATAEVMTELTYREREILRLRYGLGFDSAEVAEKMGYHPSSVRKVARRCMAALTYQMVTRGFSTGTRGGAGKAGTGGTDDSDD